MAPLLTLITYLVAAALAIGYVCETGLPFWRRVTASVLGLVLAVGVGQVLTSSDPVVAYVTGIPSLLLLGAIMIAPERTAAPPASPGRRASDRARPTTALSWQFDRRASGRRAPRRFPGDPRAALYTSTVAQADHVAPLTRTVRAAATTRLPGGGAIGIPGVAGRHLAARRRQSRRAAPRSLSRLSRCRYR